MHVCKRFKLNSSVSIVERLSSISPAAVSYCIGSKHLLYTIERMSGAFIRKLSNSTVFESMAARAGRVENNGFGNTRVHGEKEGLFDGGGG